MKLSVVIATKDRAGFLERTLDSLARQVDAPAFEVVVVDNGSTDATAAVVAVRANDRLRRVYVAEPNRGKARNAGVSVAIGEIVLFIDDDVSLPPRFLAAHAAAHRSSVFPLAVSGPIINVPSYDATPKPKASNYSRAYFCTCNVSVRRAAFIAVGGFDERFDLYGWEDTELGLRLRRFDVRRMFAWDAYLYHIKPPATETLDYVLAKTTEKGRMAATLLGIDPSVRAKLATGGYAANLVRSLVVTPPWSLAFYERAARNERLPDALRAFARSQLLDGAYTNAFRRARREDEQRPPRPE